MAQSIKVAINGFGRIGRQFLKIAWNNPQIKLVAVNDLGDIETQAYLLKYDSTYGPWQGHAVEAAGTVLAVDGKKITYLSETEPANLPWKELGVDVVVEATGIFTEHDKAAAHLSAGAKRVVISAPAKDEKTPTATPRINEENLKTSKVTSNASCTTNSATPVMQVLEETLGVKKAFLSTVHGYTADQRLVDAPHKDPRRGRAAAVNIVPTTTGSAIAASKVVTSLDGKFDGIAIRVPVQVGSASVITFVAKRKTTVEEVQEIFKKAAKEKRWRGVMTVTKDPIVSTDIIGNPHGAIVDLGFINVVDGDLVSVLSWYDNEWGYTTQLVSHVCVVGALAQSGK